MIDNLKKILNEDQDPKAIEKITSKLENLLMTHEEVGYIAVQKKPAITVLPDSIVVTNKRIIICKPKNLGLSMEFIDFNWDEIAASFVKEGILGAEFTFSTKNELTHTIDYLPKNQARKLYTFAKEQLDALKNPGVSAPVTSNPVVADATPIVEAVTDQEEIIEEVETEEVTSFAEIIACNSSGSGNNSRAGATSHVGREKVKRNVQRGTVCQIAELQKAVGQRLDSSGRIRQIESRNFTVHVKIRKKL